MEKEKKSIPKIILHVLEYILLAFIIFLIVFVALKACEKDVKALSRNDSDLGDSININDLEDTDVVIYSYELNISKLIANTGYTLFTYNSGYVSILVNNNITGITIFCNTFNPVYKTISDSNYYYGLSVLVTKSSDSFVLEYIFWSYNKLDETFSTEQLGITQLANTISILNVSMFAKLWISAILTTYNIDLNQLLKNVITTNYIFITEEYKQDHLFGDVVSSFLNIQFGQFTVGSSTYSLTLGTLLLFIIGLGALFIIIKVFLGG